MYIYITMVMILFKKYSFVFMRIYFRSMCGVTRNPCWRPLRRDVLGDLRALQQSKLQNAVRGAQRDPGGSIGDALNEP